MISTVQVVDPDDVQEHPRGRRHGNGGRRDGFPTVHRAGVTPVPIPNTEVKPRFGDGTAYFLGGRVARRWDLLERRPSA